MINQIGLLEKTKEYSLDNASKGYLPQVNFAGQATYQSEVTKIPISMPGITIKELSGDSVIIDHQFPEYIDQLIPEQIDQ